MIQLQDNIESGIFFLHHTSALNHLPRTVQNEIIQNINSFNESASNTVNNVFWQIDSMNTSHSRRKDHISRLFGIFAVMVIATIVILAVTLKTELKEYFLVVAVTLITVDIILAAIAMSLLISFLCSRQKNKQEKALNYLMENLMSQLNALVHYWNKKFVYDGVGRFYLKVTTNSVAIDVEKPNIDNIMVSKEYYTLNIPWKGATNT
jgi:hypothetical protein